MFCVGSLMSHVLQWTQFCALICSRGCPYLCTDDFVDLQLGNTAFPGSDNLSQFTVIAIRGITQLQVNRLVFLAVIGVAQEHR